MSEIPLYEDGQEAPQPMARADVRFTSVSVRPYPDGRRMKLSFSLTPFEERPSVDMSVTNPAGDEVATMSLIEAMDTEFDFTIHLRGPEPRGTHTLHMVMFYLESDDPGAARQVVDEHTLSFDPEAQA
jgi:hypothetical protein